MMSNDKNGQCDNVNNDKVWLRIIQINDVYELRNYPHFKTLVDTNSTQPDKTLVVLSGDFLSPSLLSGLDQGRGMVDCMNACGITHVCFGNHETDIPSHELKTRISVDSQFNWINTNMREIDDKLDVNTFPHEVIEVTKKLVDERVVTKRIGLLGLLTDDPSIYRPGAFAGAKIENVIETTEQYMKNVMNPLNLDLIIPMTHQRINEDKEFMNKFSSTFPIIIGGHDHEVYDETVEGSRVIKTGMDGDNTAIIDITWDDTVSTSSSTATAPDIKVNIIRTDTYPANESLVQRVESHERILHELHSAKIFRFHDVLRRGRRWDKNNSEDDDDDDDDHDERLFSTCNNRLGFSNGTQIFATILRMGMRADCCLMNAGNVRGGNIYDPKEQEWFTWKDLKAEFPFLTGLTCVDLPGRVIEETINQSRINVRLNPPVASGAYIHCCDQIEFDEERRKLISIKEEPFDPDKLYLCALPTNWFEGMDHHIPLLEWAKGTTLEHAKESSSKPIKEVIVEMFAALLWLEIGSFDTLDVNGDGFITRNEVRPRAVEIFGEDVADLVVENFFSVADCDGDGCITPVDMMIIKYVASDMINHVATDEEIETLQKVAAETLGNCASEIEVENVMKTLKETLGVHKNGKITRMEAMQAIGTVRRKSLLLST